MSKAQYLIERLDQIAEEYDHYKAITPEDTIIKRQTADKEYPIPCPTCGKDLIPGFMSPSVIQCPKCMHNVDLATGQLADGIKIRTLSGNAVSADGIKRSGMYDASM